MGKDAENTIPRWARDLKPGTWEKIDEYLDAGWKTMDIVRELSIPKGKVRSLQAHVQKYGPRRRLVQFSKFKDALLQEIEEFGSDMVKSLSVIAAMAVSNETGAKTQVRALEAMTGFVNVLERMLAGDQKAEDKRQQEEGAKAKAVDASEMVRRVLAEYGVEQDKG